MKNVNPYLLFNGNAEEAFTLYQSVFGGELLLTRMADMPDSGDVPDDAKDQVAHVALPLGDDQLLMASDAPPGQEVEIRSNARYFVSVETETAEQAEQAFTALSEGGEVLMPLEPAPWAERFGMVADRFQVQWMINYTGDASME